MNTPYFHRPNEGENAMATSPLGPPNTIHATPNRRVLGEMSTNQRVFSSPALGSATGGLFAGGKRAALSGSPLKRSFTAAVEEGYGMRYLKRRRVSGLGLGLGFGGGEEGVGEGGSVGRRNEGAGGGRVLAGSEEVVVAHTEPQSECPPSPTEPNTPSDSGGETHGSFSSLIDFDPSCQQQPQPSTAPRSKSRQTRKAKAAREEYPPPPALEFNGQDQEEEEEEEEEEEQQQQPQPQHQQKPSPPPTHAQTLRLRLRLAMYKIRTSQIDTPFSQLLTPQSHASNRRAVNEAVEEAVASLRREAMQRMPPSLAPAPSLVPGPLLRPTAYSSRMVQQPRPEERRVERKVPPERRLPPLALFGRHGSAPLPEGMVGEFQ